MSYLYERNSSGPDGRRKREAVIVGNVEQYPTEAKAWLAAESFRLAVNSEPQREDVLFGVLIDRYMREKLPRRHSTASKYRSWIVHHVRPKWEKVPIIKVKPLLVEEWLMSLALAPKSRGHVRSIMHILFNWAMKWEYIDIDRMNPISLVRVEGSSKRLRQPRVLTVKEFRLLLDHLQEPVRTMCIVAACLGLRASELVGLQWGDVDWKNQEVHIQRGVVTGRVDEVKTTNSNKRLPVHRNLAESFAGVQGRYCSRSKQGRLAVPESVWNWASALAVDDATRSPASCRIACRPRPNRLAQLSALVLHVASFVAGGLKGSARPSPSLRHSHYDEHLHAGGA